MSCNTCAKPFTLLRKEKGCPGCGFSYCSKCLENKIFLEKINSEAKVCVKCKRAAQEPNKPKPIEPPDSYYKRIGAVKDDSCNGSSSSQKKSCSGSSSSGQKTQNEKDQDIQDRLQKLKQSDKVETSEDEISKRLQGIKGQVPSTTDDELRERLAKLRGVPISTLQSKMMLITPDTRSEQEQIEDLLKQYHDKTAIDSKYTDDFNGLVNDMEARLHHLKGKDEAPCQIRDAKLEETPSEDEEDTIKKIIEKLKAEALLDENELSPTSNDELPFCEICNEDATMRCVGCQYLFCKRCFMDHKDDDDGCDRYEVYIPPNRTSV